MTYSELIKDIPVDCREIVDAYIAGVAKGYEIKKKEVLEDVLKATGKRDENQSEEE